MVAGSFFFKIRGEITLQGGIYALKLWDIPASGDTIPPWRDGPDPAIVKHVSLVLICVFGVFLYAAIITLYVHQALDDYSQSLYKHGSVVERGRDRQSRMNAMVACRFDLIAQLPMFFFHVGLLLLGYSLSVYFFFAGEVLVSVAIGFTTFGILFCIRKHRSGVKDITCVGKNRSVRS